jgi:hypothetical protein
MPEIGTSGSMSGDGKRGVAEWPKLPRPSSTLPNAKSRNVSFRTAVEVIADATQTSFEEAAHRLAGPRNRVVRSLDSFSECRAFRQPFSSR